MGTCVVFPLSVADCLIMVISASCSRLSDNGHLQEEVMLYGHVISNVADV